MTAKIYIEERKAGRYRVLLDGYGLVVRSTRTPFYDGARALEARGFSGPFEMWDRVRPYPRMSGDIAAAARLTVTEKQGRLEIIPWMPFPGEASDRQRPARGRLVG